MQIYDHPSNPFHGWSLVTLAVSLLGALGGILVAMVIKYHCPSPSYTRRHGLCPQLVVRCSLVSLILFLSLLFPFIHPFPSGILLVQMHQSTLSTSLAQVRGWPGQERRHGLVDRSHCSRQPRFLRRTNDDSNSWPSGFSSRFAPGTASLPVLLITGRELQQPGKAVLGDGRPVCGSRRGCQRHNYL